MHWRTYFILIAVMLGVACSPETSTPSQTPDSEETTQEEAQNTAPDNSSPSDDTQSSPTPEAVPPDTTPDTPPNIPTESPPVEPTPTENPNETADLPDTAPETDSPTDSPEIDDNDEAPEPSPETSPQGITYYVGPNGSDENNGRSVETAFATIQHALNLAQAGEQIILGEGVYSEDLRSVRGGTPEAPIVIQGPRTVIVKGAGSSHVVELNHSHLILDGFTIDGLHGDPTLESSYYDKLIYIISKEAQVGVTGVIIRNMTLKNAGGECLRLRYLATKNEIAYNTIIQCGVYDFLFHDGGKNGEGIYIGTAPEQTGDGKNPTAEPDISKNNWIHHNVIDTQGNECVDVKEASVDNLVEYNRCTGQQDPKSGGMDSRGDRTVFRNNEIYGNAGAGIRLGGDTEKDGIDNDVYDNEIRDNAAGGIKFQRTPQGKICGNTMSGNTGGDAVGTYRDDYTPTAPCSL